MTDTASIEEILSKFAGNQIDSKEFLNLLLTSDDTGIDYLQNLKKQFKEDYVTPVFKKVTDHYKKLNNVLSDEEAKKQVLNKINDPLGIVELNRQYKEKTKEILEKQLKNLNDNINTKNASAVINENKNIGKEQATFGDKEEVVSLSDKTIEQMANLFGGINAKRLKENTETLETQPTEENGLLSSLMNLLLLGGAGAMLVSMFWESHIKPWLEEKLSMKLDFLDRFEGTIEGIGKFFTMGGLQLGGGWFANLVGKAFTTFGDLLEGALSSIFKLGFGDDVVKAGAAAAPATWRTLIPKIAGGLFRGMGAVAFKSIPIIGSLISFYYAWDRFEKGDNISGIIDLVGGLSNLLVFTPLAPLALPLSIGASALNAFLDYKAGAATTQEGKQNIKMDYINKIVDFIQEIPIIGGLIKWGKGFYALGQGNWKEAINLLTETPFLGPFPAILQALVNSGAIGGDGSESFSWDKFGEEIRKSMFRWMCSIIPKVGGLRGKIAKWYGLEYDDNTGDIKIDEQEFNDENKDIENKTIQKSAKPLDKNKIHYTEDKEKKALSTYEEDKKWLKQKKEEYDKIVKENGEGWFSNAESDQKEREARLNWETAQTKLIISGNNLQKIRNLKKENKPENNSENYQENPQKFTPIKEEKKDDFSYRSLMTNNPNNSILFDRNTNTANILNENDNILAYKKDGVFDKALQEITKLVGSINKGIYKIPECLENMPSQIQPVPVGGGGGSQSNDMSYVLGGARDPIYEYRVLSRRA